MTPAQIDSMRKLYELINEKFGSLSRFSKIYKYNYQPLHRRLLGKTKEFDESLYEIIREQALEATVDVNSEVVLLQKIIEKHFGNDKAFCSYAHIHISRLLRVMSDEDTENSVFKLIAYKAYSKALHDIYEIKEYVNTMSPGKYLNEQDRRKQQIHKKEKRKGKIDSGFAGQEIPNIYLTK